MQTNLLPIFDMRSALLRRCNLRYYRNHEQVIKNSSLAAQDLYFSGDLLTYDTDVSQVTINDSFYASLHADYNVPYNPSDAKCVNNGLILDLARALRSDINSGILGANGEIVHPERLSASQILQVFHNSDDSGIPVTALNRMTPRTRNAFIQMYHKTNRR